MKIAYTLLFLVTVTSVAFSQSEFSQENATQILKTLSVDIGPRPMGSSAEHRAMEFAVQKFKEYGCDTAYIMPMLRSTRTNTTSGIAVGVKRGATKRIIVIGGHIDSAGPEIPGADDDGSGSATVIELARVLASQQHQSTLVFCCFGGEEAGLEGSKYFVSHFENIDSVALMFQIDMANGLGTIILDIDTHGASAPRWLAKAGAEEFFKLGYDNLVYSTHFMAMNTAMKEGSGSDHESFLRAGIPALDFTTDVTKPIHTPRDNFENFDPRGLKRSGDVVKNLVLRFDGGIPGRNTENYWTYLIGTTLIFVPIWVLWFVVVLSIILAVVAFISVRKRREPTDSPDRIRWSTWKMLLYAIILVVIAWFSSDAVGFMKGFRHAEVGDVDVYLWYALVVSIVGVWLVANLARKLPLSKCPYVHFKRAAIILTLFTIFSALASVKMALYPALALLFFSASLLIHNRILRALFTILAPLGLARFLFNEWFALFARSLALAPFPSFWIYAGVAAGCMFLFILFLLPNLFGVMAVIRDTKEFQGFGEKLRSPITLGGSLAACIAFTLYLLPRPVYNNLWYRPVVVQEKIDLSKHTKEVSLLSPENLAGIRLHHGGMDTLIQSNITKLNITPRTELDTTWLFIEREDITRRSGDTIFFDVELTFMSKLRPYRVIVAYESSNKGFPGFSSDWFSTGDGYKRELSWAAFPDSIITTPVRFQLVGKDSVKESIEVVYDKLAYPIDCERELTYFTLRTRYVDEHVYKK